MKQSFERICSRMRLTEQSQSICNDRSPPFLRGELGRALVACDSRELVLSLTAAAGGLNRPKDGIDMDKPHPSCVGVLRWGKNAYDQHVFERPNRR